LLPEVDFTNPKTTLLVFITSWFEYFRSKDWGFGSSRFRGKLGAFFSGSAPCTCLGVGGKRRPLPCGSALIGLLIFGFLGKLQDL